VSDHSLQSSQKLAQTTAITPRLQRALKLLQVPATELRNELSAELAANPVLEEIDSSGAYEESYDKDFTAESREPDERDSGEFNVSEHDFSVLRKMDDDWRASYSDEQTSRPHTAEDSERRDHFFESHAGETSFHQRLLEQARDAANTPGVLAALSALVGHLDERGYLTEDPRDIALLLNLDAEDTDRALGLLQGFEPAGIGARDLRECLLIQLRVAGRSRSLASRVLDEAYDDLLKRRFPEIAKKLGVDVDAVREALAEIAKLDTAPARRFAVDDNHSVAADVVVRRDEETGAWRAELTGDGVPRLRLSHPYKELLAGGRLSAKDKAYLSEKMKDGRFLIDAIAHRQNTVLGVAERLIVHQADFFEKGRGTLRPLIMATVAADLGVHETTVSRAVAGKWMRTPHGMMEMRDFFSSGYSTASGGSLAASGVKEMLADVVAAEDSEDPLSDEGIAEALEKKGVKLARRTVAKYREELGIAPRYLRRRQL
jgi:RNA polymerase sigma-54 factor